MMRDFTEQHGRDESTADYIIPCDTHALTTTMTTISMAWSEQEEVFLRYSFFVSFLAGIEAGMSEGWNREWREYIILLSCAIHQITTFALREMHFERCVEIACSALPTPKCGKRSACMQRLPKADRWHSTLCLR